MILKLIVKELTWQRVYC